MKVAHNLKAREPPGRNSGQEEITRNTNQMGLFFLKLFSAI